MAWLSMTPIQKKEASILKLAINDLILGNEFVQTTHTAAPSGVQTKVADAKGWSRELGPTYHQVE